MILKSFRLWLVSLQLFGVAISLLAGLCAQPIATRVVVVPLPPWPGTASQPDANPHAYFDAIRNQVVVASPATHGGPPDQLRYDIPNGAVPAISSTVKVLDGSRFVYQYIATDNVKAPQKSQEIGIILPDHDKELSTSGAWPSLKEATSLPDISAAVPFGKMRIVRWKDPSSSSLKIAQLTFQIESTYLPGFSDALVWGRVDKPLTAADISRLSEGVQKELSAYVESGYGRSTQMVIAPMFRADAPKKVVAANYHFALQHLMGRNRLGKQSPFANALLRSLTT